jgi:hypothetical protein
MPICSLRFMMRPRSNGGVPRSARGRRWEPVEPLGVRQRLLAPLAFRHDVCMLLAVGRRGFLVRTIFRVRVVGKHV